MGHVIMMMKENGKNKKEGTKEQDLSIYLSIYLSINYENVCNIINNNNIILFSNPTFDLSYGIT